MSLPGLASHGEGGGGFEVGCQSVLVVGVSVNAGSGRATDFSAVVTVLLLTFHSPGGGCSTVVTKAGVTRDGVAAAGATVIVPVVGGFGGSLGSEFSGGDSGFCASTEPAIMINAITYNLITTEANQNAR
jgi:hypothetical protein